MVTREELHQIVDWLPDDILEASGQAFLDFLKKENPVLYALITALEDDEPETEEERAAVGEAYADIARGDVILHEDVVKESRRLADLDMRE